LVIALVLMLLTLPAMVCPPLVIALLGGGIYLTFRIYLATPALMLEGLGPIEAVRRSFELTRRGFVRWVAVYVLTMILVGFFTGLSQLGDDPTFRREILSLLGTERALFDAVYLPLSILLQGIGLAFAAVVTTAFYL